MFIFRTGQTSNMITFDRENVWEKKINETYFIKLDKSDYKFITILYCPEIEHLAQSNKNKECSKNSMATTN
jgi:hypothetical protein